MKKQKISAKIKSIKNKNHLMLALCLVLALAIVFVVISAFYDYYSNPSPTQNNQKVIEKTIKQPPFEALTPPKTHKEKPGHTWKKIGPAYAFHDVIAGVDINVSEQPLPKNFEKNEDSELAKLAKDFNANEKVDAYGTTIYVGTSAKGPQSAIFIKNDLLIFIKSDSNISNTAWAAYVKNLK